MKLNKIFAIALAALSLTACSDDDSDYNTASGVTVEMAQATFDIEENVDMFYIPFNVTGDANGMINVTVEVKEGPANPNDTNHPTIPALKDEDYIITSYSINVPAGEHVGKIEVRNNWEQGVINDDRVFTVTIIGAEGATIGSQKSTVVTLVNVDDAYTMMLGTWKFKAESAFGDGPVEYLLTMKTPDPVTEADYYGKELYAFGLMGHNFVFLPFNFEYDADTEVVTMSIQSGTLATTSLINFTGFGKCVVAGNSIYTKQGFGPDIPVTVTDYSKIEVDPSAEWFLNVMPYPAMNQILGFWDGWTQMSLEKL